jgi:hypothetical protein
LRHHPLLVHEEYVLSRAYLNSILVHGKWNLVIIVIIIILCSNSGNVSWECVEQVIAGLQNFDAENVAAVVIAADKVWIPELWIA